MTFNVEDHEANTRIDALLAKRYPDYSRQYFQYLIDEKLVLINGEPAKKSVRPEVGDEIEVEFALTPEITLTPEDIPLDILYEDEVLIAVNKPAGMVVHPAVGNWSGTFVNALLFHCKQLPGGDTMRPGIVHRLDKDTSGVLLAAKTERAQQLLVEKFSAREIEKEYLAICLGNPGTRLIEGNIGRHPKKRKEMTILESGGREARTRCTSLAHAEHLSFVQLFPETGRTHQLRVHLKSVGAPILGDNVYGSMGQNKKYGAKRQLLHAYRLAFTHPLTDEKIELKAPVPQDMSQFIHRIMPHAPFDTTR